MTVGKRLRRWRLSKHLTQLQIHEDIGISIGAISQYENDKHLMTTDVLELLYKAYGIDIQWLVTGEWLVTGDKKDS